MTAVIAPATPLPCPFCGGEAHTTYIRDGRRVVCVKCSALGAACHHGPLDKPSADERAIAAWNTRAANCHPELVEALEAVQHMNRQGLTGSEARKVWSQVRAALAKAQGGAQ